MHAAQVVGAVNPKRDVSNGDPHEWRQATHTCAKVVGAMRAGADNAYGSVGARCSGVLAALLGGHGCSKGCWAVVSSRLLQTTMTGQLYVQGEDVCVCVCDRLGEWRS